MACLNALDSRLSMKDIHESDSEHDPNRVIHLGAEAELD